MKPLRGFALAMLLVIGISTSLFAQQPQLYHESTPGQMRQSPNPAPQADVVIAIILVIDQEQGLLLIDSELGPMQLKAAPEDMLHLHIGDKVLIHILSADTIMA